MEAERESEKNTNCEKPFKTMKDYLQSVNKRLDEQKKKKLENKTIKSRIFNGIVVFVNGKTDPSAASLNEIVLTNGGNFRSHSSQPCTHIISSSVCKASLRNFKNKKVVHPHWILESIKVGFLLPWYDFCLDHHHKNTRIKDFFYPNTFSFIQKEDSFLPNSILLLEFDHTFLDFILEDFIARAAIYDSNLLPLIHNYCENKCCSMSKEEIFVWLYFDIFSLLSKSDHLDFSTPLAVLKSFMRETGEINEYIYYSNFSAFDCGVRKGQKAEYAQSICKSLIFIQIDFDKVFEEIKKIIDYLFTISPIVQPIDPDCLLLKFSSDKDLDASTFISQILNHLTHHFSFSVRIGMSSTTFGAQIAAYTSLENNFLIYLPSDVERLIGQSPLQKLACSLELERILSCDGIINLDMIPNFSLDHLQSSYGRFYGRQLWNIKKGKSEVDYGYFSRQEEYACTFKFHFNQSVKELHEGLKDFNTFFKLVYLWLQSKGVGGKNLKIDIGVSNKSVCEENDSTSSVHNFISHFCFTTRLNKNDSYFIKLSESVLNSIRLKFPPQSLIIYMEVTTLKMFFSPSERYTKFAPTRDGINFGLKSSKKRLETTCSTLLLSDKEEDANKLISIKDFKSKRICSKKCHEEVSKLNIEKNLTHSCWPDESFQQLKPLTSSIFDPTHLKCINSPELLDMLRREDQNLESIFKQGILCGYLDVVYQGLSYLNRVSNPVEKAKLKRIIDLISTFFKDKYNFKLHMNEM